MVCDRLVCGGGVLEGYRPDASYRSWVEKLAVYGKSPQAQQELAYWCDQLSDVQIDAVACAEVPIKAQQEYSPVGAELDYADTQALIRAAPRILKVQIDELLLTALAYAFGGWVGRESVTVQHVRHGRVAMFPGLDVARTVGWFSTEAPIKLHTPGGMPIREALESVKTQSRSLPNGGIGYGVLRHINREIALLKQPEPLIRLNHQGEIAGGVFEGQFRVVDALWAGNISVKQEGVIAVMTGIESGRLQMRWSYDRRTYGRDRIFGFAERAVECLRLLASLATETALPAAGVPDATTR